MTEEPGGDVLTPIGYVRTLALAALLGVPVAFAAVLFQTTLHWLIHGVWEDLPEGGVRLGFAGLVVRAAGAGVPSSPPRFACPVMAGISHSTASVSIPPLRSSFRASCLQGSSVSDSGWYSGPRRR